MYVYIYMCIYTCRDRERDRFWWVSPPNTLLFFIFFCNFCIHLTHGGIMFNVVQPKPAIPRSSSLQQHQVVLPDPWFGNMHHLAATRTYRSEAGEKNTWETRVLDGRWSQISWSFSLLDNFHHPRRASSNHQDFQWLTGGPLASVGCNLVFKTRIAATLEIDTKEGADIKTWTADRLLADCWEEGGQQKLSHFFCIKWTSQNSIWCAWTLRAFQCSIIN